MGYYGDRYPVFLQHYLVPVLVPVPIFDFQKPFRS